MITSVKTSITQDSEPAVSSVPIANKLKELRAPEAATVEVLMRSLQRIERPDRTFDAVELVREGRRCPQ